MNPVAVTGLAYIETSHELVTAESAVYRFGAGHYYNKGSGGFWGHVAKTRLLKHHQISPVKFPLVFA